MKDLAIQNICTCFYMVYSVDCLVILYANISYRLKVYSHKSISGLSEANQFLKVLLKNYTKKVLAVEI